MEIDYKIFHNIESQRVSVSAILAEREQVLTEITPPAQHAIDEVSKMLQDPQTASLETEIKGDTRNIWLQFFNDPRSAPVTQILLGYTPLPGKPMTLKELTPDQTITLVATGYAGNKQKKLLEGGEIKFKTRQWKNKDIPYVDHLCDIAFFLDKLQLIKNPLVIWTTLLHDVPEEGLTTRRDPNDPTGAVISSRRVTAADIIRTFDKFNIGRQLALTSTTLVETDAKELEEILNNLGQTLDTLKKNATVAFKVDEIKKLHTAKIPDDADAKEKREALEKRIEEHCFEDIPVYEGLAKYIGAVVDELMERSEATSDESLRSEYRDMAIAIVVTEIGDRLSEIATLERTVEQKNDADTPAYAKDHSQFEFCRMLNMLLKISSVVENHKLLDNFSHIRDFYLAMIGEKIDQINHFMKNNSAYADVEQITTDSLLDYYQHTFKPIQDKADEILLHKNTKESTSFIDQKVETIFKDAEYGARAA